MSIFFFQAEDGIRDRSPSRGLGDVYKRQAVMRQHMEFMELSVIRDHMWKFMRRVKKKRSKDF